MSTAFTAAEQDAAESGFTKYLTFLLGGESYGIAERRVREILRLQPVTPVSRMPPCISGVINLRGQVIGVMDLRVNFGLSEIRESDHVLTHTHRDHEPLEDEGRAPGRGGLAPSPLSALRSPGAKGARFRESDQTCIVVVRVDRPGRGSVPLGLVVDGVEEVVSLARKDIEGSHDFGVKFNTDCVQGLARVNGVVKTLIDVDRVIAGEALEWLAEEAEAKG